MFVVGIDENGLGPRVLTTDVQNLLSYQETTEGVAEPICTPEEVVALSCDPSPVRDGAYLARPTGGTRWVEASGEYRFRWGTTLQGVFFVDVGGAYYRGGEWYDWENEEFVYKLPDGSFTTDSCQIAPGQPRCATLSEWKFSDGGTLQNGVASFGLGLNFRLGPLALHWTFARRTDFSDVESRWRSGFWIGHKF